MNEGAKETWLPIESVYQATNKGCTILEKQAISNVC